MQPPERIATERLVLRKPRVDDAPDLFTGYAQDPEVTRYMTWLPHKNIAETYQVLERMLKAWEAGSAYSYAITRREADAIIGMIAMHPDGFKVAIGYVLARPYWGKGYVTEAARAVIDWALQQSSIYRVFATTDAENIPSQRVLQKVGMQCEGLLRKYALHPNISNMPRDGYIYAIVK